MAGPIWILEYLYRVGCFWSVLDGCGRIWLDLSILSLNSGLR